MVGSNLPSVIKYIGSKRLLLPQILEQVESVRGARTVLDLFSGTARVGHALKRAGYRVTANDHNTYAHTLARCYVKANRARVIGEVEKLVPHLNKLKGRPGYFTETFCERSRYIQPHNGARVDAIREWIAARDLDPDVHAVLLVSLMEAADRVDSTCGLQMAYLKKWAARSFGEMELRVPDVLDGDGDAWQLDAVEAAGREEFDVVYLDPPYNQHRYLGNYHVWETLVRWDKPDVYGTACKRVDCRDYQSAFNSKKQIGDALREVVRRVRARCLIVSFNNEGYVARPEMEDLLASRGDVTTCEFGYKRYVGAQIGIYNPSGEKVGKVSHLKNREYLYVVSAG